MKTKCEVFMDDLQSKDVSKLDKWFNDTSILWIPPCGEIKGKNKILALFRAIFRRYNQLNWEISEVHKIGNERYIYFTDSWGVMKDNSEYSNKIMTEIRFDQEGNISWLSDYFKDTLLFQ